MPRPSAAPIPPAVMRQIVAMADCDARTIATYIDGSRVTDAAITDRIEGALRHYGYARLVRARGEAVQP